MIDNQYRTKIENLIKYLNSRETTDYLDLTDIREQTNLPLNDLLTILNFLEFNGLIQKIRDKSGRINIKTHSQIELKIIHKILDSVEKDYILNSMNLIISTPSLDKFGLIASLKANNVIYKDLVTCFDHLFSIAEKSIKIISPFIDYEGLKFFEKKLVKKSKQNVLIDIIVREINEKSYRYNGLMKFIKFAEKNGKIENIRFHEYYHRDKNKRLLSSIHSKIIIVDNLHFYCGSGEIRKNSFTKNLEIGVEGTGSLASDLSEIFDYFISISKKLTWGD